MDSTTNRCHGAFLGCRSSERETVNSSTALLHCLESGRGVRDGGDQQSDRHPAYGGYGPTAGLETYGVQRRGYNREMITSEDILPYDPSRPLWYQISHKMVLEPGMDHFVCCDGCR